MVILQYASTTDMYKRQDHKFLTIKDMFVNKKSFTCAFFYDWSEFQLRTEGQTYHSVHVDISEDCVLLREMRLEIQTQCTARHTLRVDKRCKRIEKSAVSKIRWYVWT